MAIPLQDKSLASYPVTSSLTSTGGNEFLYAYNSYTHSLDVFDLEHKSISYIPLEKEGDNGVLKPVSGISVHNADSIWLFSQGRLHLCNSLGEVKKSVKLPVPENGFVFVDANFSIAASKLYYNQLRNSVFYLTVLRTDDHAFYAVYEYNPDTNEKKVYPVKGNEMEMRSAFDYGWKQMPNVTYTDQYILYNFPITSNIYRVDIGDGHVGSFGGQSKYTVNLVAEFTGTFDFPQGNRHILENVHFFEVQYSPGENVYYRLHLNKTEAGSDDKFREFYNKKDLYLTVFDADLAILNEMKLDPCLYNYFNSWGVLSKGFFIAKDNEMDTGKDPEMLELDVFTH